MAIAAILFSVFCVGLSSQWFIPRVTLETENNLLRITATPNTVVPGSTEEVTLTCAFNLEYANEFTHHYKEGATTLTSIVLASGPNCFYDHKRDIAGISLASQNRVLISENMTSYVTAARGMIQQGQNAYVSVKLDATQIDVVGHHCCQGYFLNNFGDFHELNTHVDITKERVNGPYLQASPATVTSAPTDPLTLACTIHNTVADLGTLTSLVITKRSDPQDQGRVYADIAGVSLLSADRITIREASRSYVSGEGRLNGDQSYLQIQMDPTSTGFRSGGYELPGTYLCKAMFISGIGHVTNKVSEATVAVE